MSKSAWRHRGRLRVTGFGHRVGGAVGAVRRREKGNDPFWTLSNNYSHAKIITVVAMLLYLETNISYTVIQFKLPVKTISHDDCAQLRWHICNGVLFHCTRCMTFKCVSSIFYFGKLILCVMWRFSITYFFFLHINYILAVWSAIIKHFHKRSCDESGIHASKAFC